MCGSMVDIIIIIIIIIIICYSMLSTSPMEVTLQHAGSVHQVDHGKQGYNKSSRIMTVTLT